jgi:hypothetical protein
MKNATTLAFASAFALALAAAPQPARAEFTYPLLNEYEALAGTIVEAVKVADASDELEAIRLQTKDLTQLGVRIMDLYASKNPKCAEQFAAMIGELAVMETLSAKALHDKYHDGIGLPAAPKHCYFGRSQVVHPMMSYVTLGGAWDSAARKKVLHEIEEVIEHLARIQKNLDTPPN